MATTARVCESEQRFREYQQGVLGHSLEDYVIGCRKAETLQRVARAHLWGRQCNQMLPIPPGWEWKTWLDRLDNLVLDVLGNRHCLHCGLFFIAELVVSRVILQKPCNIDGPECPHCCSILSESLEVEPSCIS